MTDITTVDNQSAPLPRPALMRRAVQILTGHAFLATANWLFDNPLYLFVIHIYGPLVGGVIMTILSMLVCFALLVVYERMKIDWLGVNALEHIKAKGNKWIERLYRPRQHASLSHRVLFVGLRAIAFFPAMTFLAVLWLLKKGDVFAIIALSIYQDAFVTTAFMRHGRFDGLRARDWIIFIISLLLSNLYWILRSCVILEGLRFAWRTVA